MIEKMKERLPPPSKLAIALVVVVLVTGGAFAASVAWHSPGTSTSVYDAPNGPTIAESAEFSPTSQVPIRDGVVDFGMIEFRGDSASSARLESIDDTETELTGINTGTGGIEIHDSQRQRVDITGSVTSLRFTAVDLSSSSTEFVVGGSGTLEVYGLPASDYIRVVKTGSTDEIVSTDANGVASLSVDDGDEFSIIETNTPEFSDESPGNQSEIINYSPVELSINVSDDDFNTVQGDSLNVTFYDASDDSIIGNSPMVTENETVTQDWDLTVGGMKSWYVTASDEYGNTAESDTFTFQAPRDIQIYDESNPETLIDDREVTLEIYNLANDQIFTETVENGTLPLEGFPNEDYVIRMSADGYYDRSVIIRGIFQQQRLYMLNSTVQTATPTYLINDETGQFDPTDSRVFIERGLTIDNETRYQTIAAEQVGTDGFTEQVEQGVRYRIVVENQEGDIRTLGKYSADRDGDLVLTVDAISFEFGADDDVIQWSAEQEEINEGEWIVRFNYNDPEARTKSLDVVIHERFNESNELHNGSYMGPIETISVVEPLEEGQENKQWVVKASADRNPLYEWQLTVDRDGQILDIPMDPHFIYVLSGISIVLIGGLASLINAPSMGIATAGVASIYWYIGFLPPLVGAGVVLVGFAVPVLYVVGMRRGGGV